MLLLCKKFILAGGSSPYTPGQVLLNLTSGSKTVEVLDNGIYELRLVGGGGGASIVTSLGGSGGSGSAFVGQIRLTKGTYSASAGALGASQSGTNTGRAGTGGNSNFGSAYAYGATGGYYSGGGVGGSAPSIPYTIISSSVNTAGANGTSGNILQIVRANGGASKYDGYGKGTGIYRTSTMKLAFDYGTSGLVYLAYVGR